MSYCLASDIAAAVPSADLIQITNDAGGTTVDTTVVDNMISYVDNIIDGYIRGRYGLPLITIPDELKYLAIDFVVYKLYTRRMFTEVPESVNQRYKEIMGLLKDIQKGTYTLGIDTIESGKMTTDKTAISSSKNQYYNEDKWDEFDSWL
jgi:phage gp36-like protein